MRPLILDFQLNRTENEPTKFVHYQYDPRTSMSVLIGDQSGKSLIDSAASIVEQGTSTRTRQEQDDFNALSLLETTTKVGGESSDRGFEILELKTKTFTKTEADDDRLTHYQ